METKAEAPFALPLAVDCENYENDYVIHDAKWLRVAAFRKSQVNAKAKAEFLRDAVNSYSAFEAMKVAAQAVLSSYVLKRGIWYHDVMGGDMEAQQSALTQLHNALALAEETTKDSVR